MSDDRHCGCDDVGALAYIEAADETEEVDPVLDEPDDIRTVLVRLSANELGALEMIGDELVDLDGDDLGFIDTAIDLGLKLGKKVADVVSAPSKSKAKQARSKANAAQQKAAALEAELKQAKAREAKQKRQQEVMEERRRNQEHQRQVKALEDQIKDFQQQQMLVRRQMGKEAAKAREADEKAAEKERQSRNRKLAVGGGVAATSLLALWAFNRRPKARDDEERRR